MPMMTMLVIFLPSAGTRAPSGVSRSGNRRAGRAPSAPAPTISSAVRLRTSFWVPVWQKVQVSVQPTWLETQSAPRPTSGM